MEYKLKHPILLPSEGRIISVIMRYYHEKVARAGGGITINELRSQGYWIINCTSAMKLMISKCVDCRQYQGKFASKRWVTCHQIDLPRNHLLPIVVWTCLGHFWLKMVVNKENIMVQCLHVCPAEWCILKLQTAWVLIPSYWHWEDSLVKEGMSGWSVLIMEPFLLGQTSN